MGIVRRHPFLTLIFVVGSLPVVALLALEAAQHTGACAAWRTKVDAIANHRVGPPSAGIDWRRADGVSPDEFYGGVREHVAHEMRDSRPMFCE